MDHENQGRERGDTGFGVRAQVERCPAGSGVAKLVSHFIGHGVEQGQQPDDGIVVCHSGPAE